MRRLLLPLGIAWALVTLVPWWAGREIEARYEALLESAESPPAFAFETTRYERGFFSSRATTVVEPVLQTPPASAPDEAVRMVLEHRIFHGPYPLAWLRAAAFDGTPALAWATSRVTLEFEDEETIEVVELPVVVESHVSRSGDGTIRLRPDAEAALFEDPELHVDWDGTEAELAFNGDGSQFDGRFAVPLVRFDGEEQKLRLAGLEYGFAYERDPEVGDLSNAPFFVGGSHFALRTFVFEGRNGRNGRFELHDLAWSDSSDVVEGAWEIEVEASLDRVGDPSRPYGPMELDYRMAGLALEPLVEFATLAADLQEDEAAELAPTAGPAVAEAMKAELVGALGALWPKLMAAGPVAEVPRFRLVTPEGEIRASARIGVDGSQPNLLVHPLMTIPAVELDLELALPVPVFEAWTAPSVPSFELTDRTDRPDAGSGPMGMPDLPFAKGGPADWIARGWVERHGESYVTSLRMRGGALRVNGRVVDTGAGF